MKGGWASLGIYSAAVVVLVVLAFAQGCDRAGSVSSVSATRSSDADHKITGVYIERTNHRCYSPQELDDDIADTEKLLARMKEVRQQWAAEKDRP